MIFDKFGVDEIWFDYLPTSRNTPLQEFLVPFFDKNANEEESNGDAANGGFMTTRKTFDEHCPPLFHRVKEHSIV
jgi:hypothetical protein